MPSTSAARKSRSSSSRRSGGSPDSTMIALGLAAAGGAYFLLKPKTASAAEAPGSRLPAPNSGSARPTSELSEALKQQMAEALGRLGVSPATGKLSGAADADAIRSASQLVGTLQAMGFEEAAAALRKYVDEAAKSVKTPASAAPIAKAAPAGLTQEQRDYIARVMSLEREPNKIALLIDWLRKLSPSAERDTMIQMAQALALQLAAAQSTAVTMNQIDQVIQAPSATEVQQASAQPLPPAYVPTSSPTPSPKPQASSPSLITSPGIANIPGQGPPSLPETPLVVPSRPIAQPVPVPATPVELAAKAMIANLLSVQKQFGVSGAKGKEDKNLVKKFQTLAGTTADGLAGPATLLFAAGKGAVELPLVYYWPKTATATTVQQYKTGLEKIAAKFDQMNRSAEAAVLRASLARENGQSGITGPTAASSPSPKPPAPNPVPSKALTDVVDPRPAWPLIKQGDKDSAAAKAAGTGVVTTWQKVLVKGGFLPATAASTDGVFGGGTTAATKKLQSKAGMIPSAQDGVVGPNTRKAANYLGLW